MLNFIVLDGKLAAGHKNKDRNPYCILSGHECSKTLPTTKTFSREKIWVPINFLLNKNVSRGPQLTI
jgi:ribosomal protein S26